MKVLNQFVAAIEAREQFLKQYDNRVKASFVHALNSLGAYPHPDDVDALFKSAGLGHLYEVQRKFTCNECGGRVDEVVELGDEPDYESNTACICAGCLFKALKLVDGD